MKLTILCILLCWLKATDCLIQGLDPWSDMEEEPARNTLKTNKPLVTLENVAENVEEIEQAATLSADDIFFYYNRLIKTIFSKNNFKLDKKSGSFSRSLHIHVSEDQFSTFNNVEKSIENLRKFDGLFSDIIENSHGGTKEILHDLFENCVEIFYNYVDNTFVKVVGCLLLAVIVIMMAKKYFVVPTFRLLMFIFLVSSYFWTYYSMYNELEVKRMLQLTKYENQPPECDSKSMTIFTTFRKFLFRGYAIDNCEEYWMKISMSTWQSLDPAAVAIEMITRLFTQPISTVSSRIGIGLTVLFDTVPFPLNLIIFPIGVLMLFLLIIYFGSFILGIPVVVNFLHLIQFRTGHDQQSRVQVQTQQGAIFGSPPTFSNNLLHNLILKVCNQPRTATTLDTRRIKNLTFKTKKKRVHSNPAIMCLTTNKKGFKRPRTPSLTGLTDEERSSICSRLQ